MDFGRYVPIPEFGFDLLYDSYTGGNMKIRVFIISLTLAVALIAAGALTTSAADYYIMPGCNPPGYTSSYPCPNCDDNMVYDRFDDSEYVPLYEC